MHYCCMVFTKDFPNDDTLEKVLNPFSFEVLYDQPEPSRVYPAFTWDRWIVGGRYAGGLKLKIEEENEKYRWNIYERNPRNGRLFRSHLLDQMKKTAKPIPFSFCEEEWFRTMGSWDGYIRVDAAFCDDVINLQEFSCYCVIDCDGNAFSRESWDGSKLVSNEDFETQLKNIKDNSSGCYVCIVDIHD